MVNQIFLGEEDSTSKSLTIADTPETIISYPCRRKSIYLRNISTAGQVITVKFSNRDAAVAGTGYILNVNDVIIDANGEGYKCWTGKIRAIASAAGATLAVVEMKEDNS